MSCQCKVFVLFVAEFNKTSEAWIVFSVLLGSPATSRMSFWQTRIILEAWPFIEQFTIAWSPKTLEMTYLLLMCFRLRHDELLFRIFAPNHCCQVFLCVLIYKFINWKLDFVFSQVTSVWSKNLLDDLQHQNTRNLEVDKYIFTAM